MGQAASSDGAAARAPHGVGGWLVLPVLFLVAVAFATAEYLVEGRLPGLRPEVLAGNVAVLVGCVVMLTLIFRRRAVVPPLMVVFYVTLVGVCALEYASLTRFSAGIDPAVVQAEIDGAREGLGYALTNAILWIPYFLVSERVRNTFVE